MYRFVWVFRSGIDDYGNGFFIFVFSKVIQDGLLKVHIARHDECISNYIDSKPFTKFEGRKIIEKIHSFVRQANGSNTISYFR